MGKAETLQRIKETEAQIRTTREAAERDREKTLRAAREEALDLLETYREQAEARYRDSVTAAETAVATERAKILAAAREEATRTIGRGQANVYKAVDLVLAKFRGALHV